MKTYLVDTDQLAKLRLLADQLQAGSDKERDYGHRLWQLVEQVQAQEYEDIPGETP